MKKFLHMQKGVFALLLALFLGMGTAYAYDFSATYSGKTFYFNITNSSQHYVEITYPGTSTSNPWGGYTKPTGTITLPSSITHSGVSYTVTAIGDYAFFACTGLTGTLTIPNTVMYIWSNAFSGCGFTGSLSIPNTVEIIGDNAFSACSGLTSLSIGTGVEIIGTGAFWMCTGFRGDLTIPNTQQIQINSQAFYGCGFNGKLTIGTNTFSLAAKSFGNCTGFTEIRYNAVNCHDVTETMEPFEGCTGTLVIGSGVQKIPAYMFKGCSGFTGTLTIPTSVTTIGTGAFQGCTGFTQVNYKAVNCADVLSTDLPFGGCGGTLTIGNTVQRIPSNMFYNCTRFTSLNIGSSVTTIGDYAFYYCGGLHGTLTIPNSVTTIGWYAFGQCYNIEALILGSSVTTIGSYAFLGCNSMVGDITIPDSVITIGDGAFQSNSMGAGGNLTLGSSLTTIGMSAFSGSYFVGSLTIPNSVTSIGMYAFSGCTYLSGTLTVGTGVTSLGKNAFKNCGFTQVIYKATNCADVTSSTKPFEGCGGTLTIGSSVQRIPAYLFYLCSGFTGSLTIPNSVTTIGQRAFDGCVGFDGSLTLGSSLTTIGNYAFNECNNFTGSLTIPSSVTTIGNDAFNYCTSFTGLLIGSGVTTIGDYAFCDCWGITGLINTGNSVTSIGNYAFSGCDQIGSIVIMPSVTTIGSYAFHGCSSLGYVYMYNTEDNLTSIGNKAFQNCNGLTQVKYEGSIEGWCNISFENSYSNPLLYAHNLYLNSVLVTDLVIPEDVAVINDYAFAWATCLTSLTIGGSVTSIGSAAFDHCTNLAVMTVYPETPPTLGQNAFNYVPTTIPVYVPCESLDDYQAATGWSAFTNMQCMPETLTVYDGTTTNGYVPVYGYWADAYLKAEFVMPASALADMANGTINGMKFYATQTNVNWGNANFKVFLTEVEDAIINAFAGPGTVVYEGALSIVDGEMTVNFTTPYQYGGGNLLVGIYNTVKGSYVTSTWYGEYVTGASVQGYSTSSLSAITPTQRDFIPKTTFSYTPSKCSYPKDLFATDITSNSATLDWTGYQNSYDLRYRKKPIFFEDFNDGLPSGWTIIDNDGDGYNWYSMSNAVYSQSYVSGTALTPDNWLVTSQLSLQGTMKVWLRSEDSNYPDDFAIYLSTTGNSVSNFTTVLVPVTTAPEEYGCFTADLSAYAGQQGYIAIRHFNCTDMYELSLDNFGLFEDPNETGEWVEISNIGPGYTLDALVPDTEYEWQVRGRNCGGGGNSTGWSRAHSFATLPFSLCPPEDQCELTFTLTDSYGDGWNGAAINVVDVETNTLIASMSALNHGGVNVSSTDVIPLAVCDGRELRFEWVSGNWDGECSYTVTGANGNVVFTGSGAMSQPFTYTVNCNAVAQTVQLAAGTNWFSTYVDITLDDLKTALLTALPNTSITIKSRTQSTKYVVRTHTWNGILDWDVAKMYKIEVPSACELTLEGMPINPIEHPVTIVNGPNWIGYPLAGSMTVTAAFANFGVVTGDVVKSKSGSTRYRNGSWRPNGLNTLEPGQGYIYNSAATGERTLVFPSGAK